MKKYFSISLILVLIVSMLAVPTYAAKPENPGNSNKTEKTEKDNGKSEKADKVEKEKDEETDEVSGATAQSSEDYDVDEDADSTDETDDEEKIVIEDEKTSDKVNKMLKQWKNRYETYNGDEETDIIDEDENTEDSEEESDKKNKKDKDTLPPGLEKRDGELPPGLAKKDLLPYGLLKRIDPDAIPKGQVKDDITGESIDIETLLVDSVELLESAIEGNELGEYFNGSIAIYDDALTLYTDLVSDGEATEEELAEAAETLNNAYNTFIMSRTATLDELVDYNTFLEEVSDIIENLEVGTEDEDDITPENYDALVAYFDTLAPFEVETDEENNIEPDKVSIEAMLTLFDKATTQFDEFMGYEEAIEEDDETEDDIDEDETDQE